MQQIVQLDPFARDIPHTKRGHELCISLLLSANELFLERGYDAVSLDDIVHHAGGSKASIYKFFGNKEGLFTAICDYRREQFFKDICVPFEQDKHNLKTYLIRTLLNFHQHLLQPENTAFMRLVLERTQRSSELALYIHEQGPKHIQSAIACALQKAHSNGVIKCENPIYSAQFYFGILRDLEWRILIGLPIEEDEQETITYLSYCVDRFLEGHQKD